MEILGPRGKSSIRTIAGNGGGGAVEPPAFVYYAAPAGTNPITVPSRSWTTVPINRLEHMPGTGFCSLNAPAFQFTLEAGAYKVMGAGLLTLVGRFRLYNITDDFADYRPGGINSAFGNFHYSALINIDAPKTFEYQIYNNDANPNSIENSFSENGNDEIYAYVEVQKLS